MENFWDYSAWGAFSLVAVLLIALLLANIIKRFQPVERVLPDTIWYKLLHLDDTLSNHSVFICIRGGRKRKTDIYSGLRTILSHLPMVYH